MLGWEADMKQLIKLALPTSSMFLGIMLMGVVDLLFVGKLGAAPLGGLGLGNSIFSWIMTIGIGMIFGLDYPIAHAIGSGNRARAFRIFAQGVHLSYLLGLPAALITVGIAVALDQFGLNPEVIPYARTYMVMTAISFFPIFLFNAAKSYLQAQSIAVPTFAVLIFANLLNLFLCAAFIEGRFGFPNYGFEGLPYATVISRFVMAALLVGYILYRELGSKFKMSFKFDRDLFGSILKLGLPSSAQMLLEVGVFSLSTALAAKFSSVNLAAHQLVLNTASVLFMVPLGIGSAAASLVGQAIGANDPGSARRTGNSALLLGFLFALCSSALLIIFADPSLRIYSPDTEVIEAAKRLLFIAALFQISDGIQVIATGALRGLGNTVTAAVANGVGHWLVGLPLGLILGFSMKMEVYGVWIGLALGLTVVAAGTGWAWFRESKKLGELTV